MNKLMRSALAASVIVAGLSVATAPSAMAAAGDGVCTYTEACVFKLKNYGGGMADIRTNDSDWRNDYFTSGGDAHNSGSSGLGQERALQFYASVGYGGNWFILGNGEYDPHWTTNQRTTPWKSFNFDNTISSSSIYIP